MDFMLCVCCVLIREVINGFNCDCMLRVLKRIYLFVIYNINLEANLDQLQQHKLFVLEKFTK